MFLLFSIHVNLIGLDEFLILNKLKSFIIFFNLIQSTWDRNNRTNLTKFGICQLGTHTHTPASHDPLWDCHTHILLPDS
jgi:hypothetical protein